MRELAKRPSRPTLYCLVVLLMAISAVASAEYHDHDHDHDHGHGHGHGHGHDPGITTSDLDTLIGQIRVAVQHASFSLAATNINSRQTHAHHVVNIIEGTQGPNFDGSKGNPGDGYGALTYAQHAVATGDAAPWLHNVIAYLTWARDEALTATRTSDLNASGQSIHRSLAFLSAALGREDDQGSLGGALAVANAAAQHLVVDIQGDRFADGRPLTVAKGTTVTWINRDVAPHTVTGGPLQSPLLNQNDTFTYTFNETGTFFYVCAVHPWMTHTIIVE